jgi:hypothetical protein
VDPSDIDDQFVIDEDPDVVISTKREDLRTEFVVGELCLQFKGEVEISVW